MTMTVDKIVEGVADSAGLQPFASTYQIHEGISIASNNYEILLMIYSGTPISLQHGHGVVLSGCKADTP
jgi:hypothetical protein